MKSKYVGYLTSPEFSELIKSVRGVILVIGSCEQHGYHMPLETDNIIGNEIAIKVAEATELLLLPAISYGQVWSAKDFPGTIAISSDTIKRLIRDIVISLERFNVKNIILFSAHNGNTGILKESARELYDEFGWENIWHFSLAFSGDLLSILESKMPGNVHHAGELETSMMLAIRPDLVHMEKATKEFPLAPKAAKFRPIPWNAYVSTGAFGDSTLATEKKGKVLLKSCIEELIQNINDVIPK